MSEDNDALALALVAYFREAHSVEGGREKYIIHGPALDAACRAYAAKLWKADVSETMCGWPAHTPCLAALAGDPAARPPALTPEQIGRAIREAILAAFEEAKVGQFSVPNVAARDAIAHIVAARVQAALGGTEETHG